MNLRKEGRRSGRRVWRAVRRIEEGGGFGGDVRLVRQWRIKSEGRLEMRDELRCTCNRDSVDAWTFAAVGFVSEMRNRGVAEPIIEFGLIFTH